MSVYLLFLSSVALLWLSGRFYNDYYKMSQERLAGKIGCAVACVGFMMEALLLISLYPDTSWLNSIYFNILGLISVSGFAMACIFGDR